MIEDVLTGLYGTAPLRVAMGATIPIGGVFQRQLGLDPVFFSFATADEDYHAPERVLSPGELSQRADRLGPCARRDGRIETGKTMTA